MNRRIHDLALFILFRIKSEDKANKVLPFWTLDVVTQTDCFTTYLQVFSKSVGTWMPCLENWNQIG